MDLSQYLCGTPARSYIFQDETYGGQIRSAARALSEAEAVLIGAGAGLSTAAGLTYSGKRFTENFGEFIKNMGKRLCVICMQPAFIHFPRKRKNGDIGQNIPW